MNAPTPSSYRLAMGRSGFVIGTRADKPPSLYAIESPFPRLGASQEPTHLQHRPLR